MTSDAATAPVVLAEDVRARVEVVDLDGRRVVRKTYKSPPHLRWRSAFRRSRAWREHTNLDALQAAGLPCIRTVSWSEDRRWGCVTASTLVTELLADANDLQSTIQAEREPGRRVELARNLGHLLRALHDSGYASTTASPRNFLVATGSTELVLIDQPHLVGLPAGPLRRRFSQGDLFDAFFSPRRLVEWSRTERWRGLLAYCKDDAAAARAVWRRLSGRWRWTLRLDRSLARILSNLRPTRIPTPTT